MTPCRIRCAERCWTSWRLEAGGWRLEAGGWRLDRIFLLFVRLSSLWRSCRLLSASLQRSLRLLSPFPLCPPGAILPPSFWSRSNKSS
ncbi:hypothetical protein DNK01_18275 [Stutzerimonas kirkiae]|nr:hypothetical protein DNK01_18275 [Stutzerimonas kirkiae]